MALRCLVFHHDLNQQLLLHRPDHLLLLLSEDLRDFLRDQLFLQIVLSDTVHGTGLVN